MEKINNNKDNMNNERLSVDYKALNKAIEADATKRENRSKLLSGLMNFPDEIFKETKTDHLSFELFGSSIPDMGEFTLPPCEDTEACLFGAYDDEHDRAYILFTITRQDLPNYWTMLCVEEGMVTEFDQENGIYLPTKSDMSCLFALTYMVLHMKHVVWVDTFLTFHKLLCEYFKEYIEPYYAFHLYESMRMLLYVYDEVKDFTVLTTISYEEEDGSTSDNIAIVPKDHEKARIALMIHEDIITFTGMKKTDDGFVKTETFMEMKEVGTAIFFMKVIAGPDFAGKRDLIDDFRKDLFECSFLTLDDSDGEA
ncbi:MAG: hypothetical protein Q4E53_12075 [Eubacteriales bacterium]|nr:hypothetical protein [Eubacteriales bacterium]